MPDGLPLRLICADNGGGAEDDDGLLQLGAGEEPSAVTGQMMTYSVPGMGIILPGTAM